MQITDEIDRSTSPHYSRLLHNWYVSLMSFLDFLFVYFQRINFFTYFNIGYFGSLPFGIIINIVLIAAINIDNITIHD